MEIDRKDSMQKRPLQPPEILDALISLSVKRSAYSFFTLFILSCLAGAFIGLAGAGSNMAAFNLLAIPETYGLGRALAGAVFATGLMLVVLTGGELFTGNTLILTAVFEKKVTVVQMLRNWCIVYIGNLVGGLFIAFCLAYSGLLQSGGGMLGAMTLKTAVYKVHLSGGQGIILGLLCNWLVCLAIWNAAGADTMAGKILGIFFPIWLFITSGFEHSIANMYYIPAGILIKGNEAFCALAGISAQSIAELTWGSFFIRNLLPVTFGNLIGGGVMTALAYWYVYKRGA